MAQPGKAIKQIKQKGYHQKFPVGDRKVYIVGIILDSKKRNIKAFEWERVGE